MMAFLLSGTGRAISGAAVLIASFFAWLLIHDARVEKGATSAVITKIEKKSDADTILAQEVRRDVAAGKRGKPDPHRLRPVSAAAGKDRPGE